MSATILIVDSDRNIRDTLAKILETEKHNALNVGSGEEALQILDEKEIAVMIAEVYLPGMGGIKLIKAASQISPGMISILLTGQGTIETAIEALRLDAHDYLLKPVSPPELLSSISGALARRDQTKRKHLLLEQLEVSIRQLKEIEGMSELSKPERRVIALPKDVQVDLARRQLWRGSDSIHLTPTEGKMLRIFIENWGRVMSHSEIAILVQGYEVSEFEAPDILRPLISRLRKKLGTFPRGSRWIQSVRGTGYVFDAEMPV